MYTRCRFVFIKAAFRVVSYSGEIDFGSLKDTGNGLLLSVTNVLAIFVAEHSSDITSAYLDWCEAFELITDTSVSVLGASNA